MQLGPTTMSDETLHPKSLLAEGRFHAAMVLLRQRSQASGKEPDSEGRLLMAEVLERTGHLAEARTQVAALRKSPRLTESARVRCMMVDGLVSKQLGHLEDSATAFRRAYEIAERIDSPELRAWSQLRLLGVSMDLEGRDLDAETLSGLRCNIEQAAVPALATAHQVFLAEYHA